MRQELRGCVSGRRKRNGRDGRRSKMGEVGMERIDMGLIQRMRQMVIKEKIMIIIRRPTTKMILTTLIIQT